MSHASLPAALVMRACERYKEARDARIERARQNFIAHHMRPIEGFWDRLWRRRPMTRDEAERFWVSCGEIHTVPTSRIMTEIECGLEWSRVRNLHALASMLVRCGRGSESVQLSADDFAAIAGFIATNGPQ